MPRKRTFGVRLIESELDSRRAARARGEMALEELERAIRDRRPLDHRRGMTILYALNAWRAAKGALSLDQALGLVGPGFDHVLVDDERGARDNAYLVELARLLAIGFKAKEADIAVAERFAATPPWGRDHAFLKPLKLSTVTSLRKQWLGVAADLRDGRGPVKLFGQHFAEASSWNAAQRAAYLATYPGNFLPERFR